MPSTSSRRIQAASTNIGNYERTQPDQNRVHSSIVGESRQCTISRRKPIQLHIAARRVHWLRASSVAAELHRESKKQDTKIVDITSLTIVRFSKFFSLADSVVNLQQIHV